MRMPPGRTGSTIHSNRAGLTQAVARRAVLWPNSPELTDASSGVKVIHVPWGVLVQPRPRRTGFGCPVRDGPRDQVQAGTREHSH
jgi:hypothetical protein